FKVGNGRSISVWYDRWDRNQALAKNISKREIHLVGFNDHSKLYDIIDDNNWKWPDEWLRKYNFLHNYPVPTLVVEPNILMWATRQGKLVKFSTNQVWANVRSFGNKVLWDKLCKPIAKVWETVKGRARIKTNVVKWADIIKDMAKSTNQNNILNIIGCKSKTNVIEDKNIRTVKTAGNEWQAPTEGYGEAIVIPKILAKNFEIKTNLLQMTATLKYMDVPNDAIKLMLFSYSLEGAARVWYEKEPPNSILTWDDLVNKFVNQCFPPSKTTHLKNEISRFTQRFEETFGEAWDRFKEMLRACPHHGFSELTQIDTFYNGLTEQDQDSLNAAVGGNLLNKTTREALKIIKNKSKVHYSRSKSNVSRVNTNSRDNVSKTDDRIDKLGDQISNLVEIVNKQVIAPAKAVEKTCVTCRGAHAYYECIATDSNHLVFVRQLVPTTKFPRQTKLVTKFHHLGLLQFKTIQIEPASTLGTLPSNTVPNPKGEMKTVTTCSGLAYEGPSIPTESSLEKVDEQNTKKILDKEHSNSSRSTAQVQPPVVPISIPEPDVQRTQTKPTISYPSRLNDQKLREKATNQMEKFFQIFHDLYFDISFADALLLMLKFASTIKSLLANKDKLFELAKVSLNENCSAMLLKKLPEKLGDPKLTPTRMTLELADRSITRPKGVAEDVFVKVGKFHFPTDFVVVDFKSNLRVPLILRRSFLRTGRALIDVYGEEITLRNDASKEPIVKSSSPTLTLFGESSFFLEGIEDFSNDDSILIRIENYVYDPEGDIIFLKKLLNEDPFQLPPIDLKLVEESKEKSSVEEPPELEFPSHLEYAFLEDSNKLPKISDIKGIDPRFCTHKILMEDDYKPAVQSQRRVNPKIHDVIKKEVIKLLDAGMIYHISDSPWVSPIHCVPKKGGMIVVADENNKLIPTRLVTGWRVCIDYRKLDDATRKDHFSLPFMDQMLERLAGNEFYCFLDGFSRYFQIPIDPQDQEKTTFTCPYGTFAYRRMPFGLCNALGHKILKSGIEVDRAKVDAVAKLPHPTTVKGVRSFLGHAGFYRRFIQDFSKIARPMTRLLEKETPFVFSKECIDAFNTLKKKLTEAPILVVPDWNLPFELMCDASDYAIGVVLGLRKSKNFQPIHYASKTMTEAQIHFTTTEKEMLVVVYAFENFWPYLVLFKSIVYTDHSALKYLLNKQDTKPRQEAFEILKACHEGPSKGHHGANLTAKKGIDFMGPFPSSKENKYILVAVDYLSKWVEVKALPSNDARVVVKFLKSLFSRFGIPREIISDRGTHFCNDQFTRVMSKYGVTHWLATAYHPQTSGQVEVSNRGLKRILERTVGENRTSWFDKLDDALWAFRTAYKTPIGCTPYKLTAGDHRKLQLNELSELRDQAYENSVIFKARMKKLHDSKIKNRIFNVSDQVLLFNSRLKIFSGKLKTRCSGPFTFTRVFLYGTIELSQPNGLNFKVNGHRVKHYFGGDIPSNVALDLHTFPMDN
nr:DNA-directed DNA polymerase [Tanacetum cinerariifolium]